MRNKNEKLNIKKMKDCCTNEITLFRISFLIIYSLLSRHEINIVGIPSSEKSHIVRQNRRISRITTRRVMDYTEALSPV